MDELKFGSFNTLTKETHIGYIDELGNMKFAPDSGDEIFHQESWVTLPRWAKFGVFLLKTQTNWPSLTISFREEKSLITETIFYKVSGRKRDVVYVMDEIRKIIVDY